MRMNITVNVAVALVVTFSFFPALTCFVPMAKRERHGVLLFSGIPPEHQGNTKVEDDGGASSPDFSTLRDLLMPSKKCNADQMSGTELAYIGDVVFELFIRSRHVWPSKRTSDLQNTVVGIVRAEHQANLLEIVKGEFPLTNEEKRIISRGRNAVTRSKNRRNPAAYQSSTAFEAFVGYLYITDQHRLSELLNWLDQYVDIVENSS